jgi:transposase
MTDKIAGIDVHKRVLMVVVGTPGALAEQDFLIGRFGTTSSELRRLASWLQQCGVREVVMESTAQYWKPVWMSLEADFRLFLAQAWSNRAPRGKKADFKDAKRLVRRHCAGELTLSFVPDAEQRQMRSLTRRREQLTRDRVRILNQVESLLEETRIKLSSVVSDLFGGSGMRILKALSEGISDPVKLAALADPRVQRTAAELADALTGTLSPIHQRILKQHLAMLELIDQQMQELLTEIGASMSEHADAIKRLCAIPGIRVLAAQQILAEVGPGASEFDSPPQFTSWAGVCPGKNESAGENHSSRCAKGNIYLRRVLCQVAQAAVRTKNSHWENIFRRMVPRLGYTKAIWAVARRIAVVIWKILHEGVEYIEQGALSTPGALKRRVQRLKKELRALGYSDDLKTLSCVAAMQ